MKTFLLSSVAAIFAVIAPSAFCAGSDLTLWYEKPAMTAINEALPVGNGHIGGLVFGGVHQERIALNDDALWTGTADDHSYGAYQTLGNLFISFDTGPQPVVSCPSGHKAGAAAEAIGNSFDGDPHTKWCVVMNDKPVIWQVQALPGGVPATSYTLTSANDLPKRDPRTWEFAGSMDETQWTVLDRQENQPPFPKRLQADTFPLNNTVAYRYYRLTILQNNGDAQMQLADIAVPGLRAPQPLESITDYRRDLNLSTAIARTRFSRNGVSHIREVLASHPDGVIAVRWTSPRGGVTGSDASACPSYVIRTFLSMLRSPEPRRWL